MSVRPPQQETNDQRRDALMLELLKTRPMSRAQLQEELRLAREAKGAANPQPAHRRVESPG
jgi:hypothetical protein